MKMEPLCLWCKHFVLSLGEDDWSDVTPGEPPTCRCEKGHWSLSRREFSLLDYRAGMLKAAECKDYEKDDEE